MRVQRERERERERERCKGLLVCNQSELVAAALFRLLFKSLYSDDLMENVQIPCYQYVCIVELHVVISTVVTCIFFYENARVLRYEFICIYSFLSSLLLYSVSSCWLLIIKPPATAERPTCIISLRFHHSSPKTSPVEFG